MKEKFHNLHISFVEAEQEEGEEAQAHENHDALNHSRPWGRGEKEKKTLHLKVQHFHILFTLQKHPKKRIYVKT